MRYTGIAGNTFTGVTRAQGVGTVTSLAGDERFRRWYARYERLSMGPRMTRAVVALDFENDLHAIFTRYPVNRCRED